MYSVLLVDDEPIVKAAFRKMISWETEGFEIIDTAGNGLDALRAIREQPVDVVITDLKMPQMDGISLIKALRAEGFEGVILVLSNYADFELVREAMVAGATDYMLKVNIDAESLNAHLRRAREALAARQKSRQKEQMMEEHGALVRAHALRTWLESPEDSAPSHMLRDAYVQGPFDLCHIAFLAPDPRIAARMPSAQHVEAILRAIYEDVRDTDIIILNERELLCVYPIASLAMKSIRRESKWDQIARQVNMYFNTPVLLLTPPPADTLSDIRAQHTAMERAAALAFYALPTIIIPPDSVVFGATPPGYAPQTIAGQLAEAYFAQGHEAVEGCIASFLDACRAAWTHPVEVTAFLTSVAIQLLSFAPNDSPAGEPLREKTAPASCSCEREQLEQTVTLYKTILAQVIPPGFAHCKNEIRKALLYIHVHYGSRVTLDDVARVSNLDRSYLCRLFRRETGTSLFSYLNALRMNAAARLIEKGDTTIRGVSERVGIDDPFYFTRLFKKRFGVSPSEYPLRLSDDIHSLH